MRTMALPLSLFQSMAAASRTAAYTLSGTSPPPRAINWARRLLKSGISETP